MVTFLALAAFLSHSCLLAGGADVAHLAVTQAGDAKPRGLKLKSGTPNGLDAIRDFLDKAGEASRDKMKQELEVGQQLDFCIVNSWVAFNYLTQALLEIDSSVEDCKDVVDQDGRTQRTCAADIFGVLQCFFSTGGYVAGLVTQCANIANQDAQCAASIVAWFGSITETFQAVLSMPQTCGKLDPRFGGKGPERRLTDDNEVSGGANSSSTAQSSAVMGRRLGTGHSKTHKNIFKKGWAGAWCYLQITSAMAYLAQAGVNMGSAARNCKDQSTPELRGACATDITGLMSSLSDVVSFTGGAASLCAKTINNAGLCAGDIGTLGNALGGLGAASASFKFTCGLKEGARLFAPGSRRLSEAVASNRSVLSDELRGAMRRLSDRFNVSVPDPTFI